MNHFLIGYELRDPKFDYEPLYTALHTIEPNIFMIQFGE